ncbi:MAG: hydroxymethylglutaryl-CoA lyase [Cryomorphaceae bacterium]|jgi:hydroxymethylglutaryl-CoA lyase
MLELIECPRDAMQGIKEFIPTQKKIDYINLLIEAGFHTIDFGSFVSPKAIPQMADTAEVLKGLKLNDKTKLLAIIANKRGAQDAAHFEEINYLGYPFSVSEEFQKRNTNTTLEESLTVLEEIKAIADKANKDLVVYLSMAFGNPYGEEWNPDNVIKWAERLHREFGIKTLALSDTIGTSSRGSIDRLFNGLIPALPGVNFGAHLHTTPDTWREKVDAAYQAGCRRFDGALKGFGGCPMAKDDLTGNMPTEKMLGYFEERGVETRVEQDKVNEALLAVADVFPL